MASSRLRAGSRITRRPEIPIREGHISVEHHGLAADARPPGLDHTSLCAARATSNWTIRLKAKVEEYAIMGFNIKHMILSLAVVSAFISLPCTETLGLAFMLFESSNEHLKNHSSGVIVIKKNAHKFITELMNVKGIYFENSVETMDSEIKPYYKKALEILEKSKKQFEHLKYLA